ncbi:MAG: CDP-glycerol glycerophosphotransferase family protein [Erysipelotrichaceae bacterium]|nr:CDP-glycerol glycerophosphotransferase family protein [Erysipelotrichaceae bacterium]
MIYFIIKLGLLFLNFIYLFFKLLPVRHKVSFISRQSNAVNSDFVMLADRLKKEDSTVETVFLCRTLDGGILNKIRYAFHMLTQMYHIATSEVVVLDTYCIAVSCLHQRKSLKVLQMWHALGCLKRFGFSILDKGEGSSDNLARAMHMHEGYTKVLCSAERCAEPFAEAFNVSRDKMYVCPLPKVDTLRSESYRRDLREKILQAHPQLKEKKNILYVPTFRKDETEFISQLQKLIEQVDYSKYNLIVKLHPVSKAEVHDDRVITDRRFSSQQFAAVADYVITDYSAIVYEMALMDVPMYFWCFDKEEYVNNRDFYSSYEDLPGAKCTTVEELLEAIDDEKSDMTTLKQFRDEFITPEVTDCTGRLAELILSWMKR